MHPGMCAAGRALLAVLAGSAVAGGQVRLPGTGGIIPADRLADWRPGISVGVPGGIPSGRTARIDVTGPPYGADPTGAEDAAPAIGRAVADAAPGTVVFLPAGSYRIDRSISIGRKGGITLRGAGPGRTVILARHPTGGAIHIGLGGADWWYEDRTRIAIEGSPAKGATVISLADTRPLDAYPGGGIGQLCQVSLRNDPSLPVVAPASFEYMRRQVTRIVARTAGTITIEPALLFDLPGSLSPRLAPAGGSTEGVGIEDLTIDGSGSRTPHGLISIDAGHGCWVRNVAVLSAPNYNVSVSDSLRCEVRGCRIAGRLGKGSNGAGILLGTSSSCLIEDNAIEEQFPHIEVNGSSGNVIAYNFCRDSSIDGLVGCSIDANHGPHSCFNLYEGNVSPKFQSDGYHGSASHDTAFRNRFRGVDVAGRFRICVNLNRFTRHYSIVGNVLGEPGIDWRYDNAGGGLGYDESYLYAFGLPNMGNGGFSGTVRPGEGRTWSDWPRLLGSERGKGPGPGGFQELDLDVRATAIVKGNYNFRDGGVPASESLGGASLPTSLYLDGKPEWFGDLPWPPFGPDADPARGRIPAWARREARAAASARGFVTPEGRRLMLGGKEYRAIGVNIPHLFQAYAGTWLHAEGVYGTREKAKAAMVAALDDARASGVAFVRFFAGPGYPVETDALYGKDRGAYWGKVDELFSLCRERGLRLVPSLGTLRGWFLHEGETARAILDPASATSRATREFAGDYVVRYRDDPAVLLWELENEPMLAADVDMAGRGLPPAVTYSPGATVREHGVREDSLTWDMTLRLYREQTEFIRSLDPNHPVTSGDAGVRVECTSRRETFPDFRYRNDTLQEWIANNLASQPEPLEVYSYHIYGTPGRSEPATSWGLDALGLARTLVRATHAARSPVFIGELGQDGPGFDLDPEAAWTRASIDLLEEEGVSLAAIWVWHFPWQPDRTVSGASHPRLMERVAAFNRRYAAR